MDWLGADFLRSMAIATALGGGMAVCLPVLSRHRPWARFAIAGTVVLVGARYVIWRYAATVAPVLCCSAQWAWIWLCFLIEAAAFVEIAVFMLILSRYADRGPEADRHEAAARRLPTDWLPQVDVFIPTYNEGIEVLEKSIVGALGLDYPRYQVWVLDDGRREWVKRFSLAKGANYLERPDNRHAKAGNLNHAYRASGGELIAIFDADFVPRHDFLWRTVGFFADPTIGIVQTPQQFFNRDPIQLNLMLGQRWPDEQRLFFDVIAPARDAWDAAFCCGSCSVVRRSALDVIGGFPTASITEDLLTSLALLRKGYITRYLSEPLSMGLAAESIEAYFIQRERWCQGGIQAIYLKEGPLGPGIDPIRRLLFFPLSWIVQYPVRVLAMIVPTVYLWTELTPLLFTSLADIASYQVPVFVAYVGAMSWFAPNRYAPVINAATSVFTAFRLLPAVASAVIRPFGKPFNVTPKGNRPDCVKIDRVTLSVAIALIAGTAGGLVVNMVPGWELLRDDAFFPLAAFWGMANMVILFLVALTCFEAPRRRAEERFSVNEPCALAFAGARWPCRILDASMSGALVQWPERQEPPPDGAVGTLDLAGVGAVPTEIVRVRGWGTRVSLRFLDVDGTMRDRLIRRLFTTGLSNAVERVTVVGVLGGLWRRAFG